MSMLKLLLCFATICHLNVQMSETFIYFLVTKYAIFYNKPIENLILNMASTQDPANTHTNQMGDFIDPLCFSRVLPPNQSPHRMGVSGPTEGALWGHITLI